MQGLLHFGPSIRWESRFHAAAALTGPGHENRTCTLTGPAPLTHAGMAAALSEAIGRPVAYVDVPDAAGVASRTVQAFARDHAAAWL